MASVDFRSGGFDGAYRRRVGDYGHEPHHGEAQVEGAPAPGLGGRIGRVVNYVAAVVSVGLVVALAVWGVRLVSRDVSGVPVIRAMVGESRVAPDEPGGELASHLGLAVNSVPAGRGGVAEGDRVAIAPAGAGLADEDLAMGDFGASAMVPGVLSDSVPAADAVDPMVALQDSELAAQRAEAEARAAEAAALAAAAEREAAAAIAMDAPAIEAASNEAVTGEAGEQVDAIGISAALAEANATIQTATEPMAVAAPNALAQSARPAVRPARAARAAAPIAAAVAAPAPTPAKPAAAPAKPEPAAQQASVASGAAVVQIGAFDSDAVARSEWSRISGKAGGLFNGKGQIVQRHESNGRVFYRLRVAGFGSSAEAQKFCASLKALGTDCVAMKVN